MKTKLNPAVIAVVSLAIASCTGGKSGSTAANDSQEQEVATYAGLKGQWDIENIIFNDSDYVRPAEEVPGVRQYITFEDSTYFIQTNCNTFNGPYTVKGDSISFGDGAMTEMACENMATEDAIRRILPGISTIDVQNDSVIRLNGASPAECIMLRKATEQQ